jgi:hypothetical protein
MIADDAFVKMDFRNFVTRAAFKNYITVTY